MKILILQNCDFEKPGLLLVWAKERNISVELVKAHEERIPAGDFTHLILLGSPHSVTEINELPWLKEEEAYARAFIGSGRHVLGICLGAQLIAHILGASVRPGPYAEIGWHRVGETGQLPPAVLFQWHREVFSLPAGAQAFGKSSATPLQGFWNGKRILALAGHPEIDEGLVKDYIDLCWSEDWYRAEVAAGRADFIQRPEEILRESPRMVAQERAALYAWFDAWFMA